MVTKKKIKTVAWLSSSRGDGRVLQHHCQPTPNQPINIYMTGQRGAGWAVVSALRSKSMASCYLSFCLRGRNQYGLRNGNTTTAIATPTTVRLSLPAVTDISDVESTITAGGIVMNLCFYRVRPSEDFTPPPCNRSSEDMCSR